MLHIDVYLRLNEKSFLKEMFDDFSRLYAIE